MRDVTLNQQEQARIQVLNSVMEYQLPIERAVANSRMLFEAATRAGIGRIVHFSVANFILLHRVLKPTASFYIQSGSFDSYYDQLSDSGHNHSDLFRKGPIG